MSPEVAEFIQCLFRHETLGFRPLLFFIYRDMFLSNTHPLIFKGALGSTIEPLSGGRRGCLYTPSSNQNHFRQNAAHATTASRTSPTTMHAYAAMVSLNVIVPIPPKTTSIWVLVICIWCPATPMDYSSRPRVRAGHGFCVCRDVRGDPQFRLTQS